MKKVWTEKMNELMRKYYPVAHLGNLAARLGVTETAVRSRAKVMGIKRKRRDNRSPWTQRQIAYLKKHYGDTPIEVLVANTHHPKDSVRRKANNLGIYKSKEYLAQFGYKVSLTEASRRTRFVKGHTSHNKGRKQREYMSAEAIERTKSTRFQRGHLPHNTKPVGYERKDSEGNIFVKVADNKPMVIKSRYVWEKHNGPIPDGMIVAFIDGDKSNCNIENLELVSRSEAVRRLVARESEEHRRSRIEKMLSTRNEIIRKDRLRIKWGLEPKSKIVKRY